MKDFNAEIAMRLLRRFGQLIASSGTLVRRWMLSVWNGAIGVLFYRIPERVLTREGVYFPATLIVVFYYAWLFLYPALPGYAIGALALVAVVMAVRADKLKKVEKGIWVVLGAALLIAEIQVIKLDREKSDREQNEAVQRQLDQAKDVQKGFIETTGKLELVQKRAEATAATLRGLEQRAQLRETQSDRELCWEIEDLREDPNISGISSYPRLFAQLERIKRSDPDEYKKEQDQLHKEVDPFFHDSIKPRIRSLNLKVRERLGIDTLYHGPRVDAINSLLEDSGGFDSPEIQAAIEELKNMAQPFCKVVEKGKGPWWGPIH